MPSCHGGELQLAAERLGCKPSQLLDASASLAPWTPFWLLRKSWSLRDYPDRRYAALTQAIASVHEIECSCVLPGNGAAELFTWAARDAAAAGLSCLSAPGFADYIRAMECWDAQWKSSPLSLSWSSEFSHQHPDFLVGDVIWICNPHNPTGQLWDRKSLEPFLERYSLVICDEAFLPLVPNGEAQSLIPLVQKYPNLVVIRSLTKLFGIAGLRLGYAVAQPERLQRWSLWRDPWPVNGIASAFGVQLLGQRERYQRWCSRVQRWVDREGAWMHQRLSELPGITPMPSAVNFCLIRGEQSLVSLREGVERHHGVLLRDCRSFEGLGENWLRIGLQDRRGNRRILKALKQELH